MSDHAPLVDDHPTALRAVADGPDPLLLALARYVQALDRRHPGGPEQMRREALDARANMPTVPHPKDPAA